ncbi:MAG TPA: NUDIX domain-containing protein [Steroidobacteraceae bacterium]|nr:NUDIX domain-containing protein [Steroidobacteraceae bacterium]
MAARLSAGVVVVRRIPDAWLFLMLRAYRNWDFPKGLVEPGEEPLHAARREVQEETLIDELQFDWGEVYRETAPYANKKIARYYVARTDRVAVTLPVRPELGRPEHDEWRWVTFEGGLALCSARLDPILRWAAETIGLTRPAGSM